MVGTVCCKTFIAIIIDGIKAMKLILSKPELCTRNISFLNSLVMSCSNKLKLVLDYPRYKMIDTRQRFRWTRMESNHRPSVFRLNSSLATI